MQYDTRRQRMHSCAEKSHPIFSDTIRSASPNKGKAPLNPIPAPPMEAPRTVHDHWCGGLDTVTDAPCEGANLAEGVDPWWHELEEQGSYNLSASGQQSDNHFEVMARHNDRRPKPEIRV